jgi:uncharacterized delta-60 repeat protein
MRISEFFLIHNLRVYVLGLVSAVAFGVLPAARSAPPTISLGSPSNVADRSATLNGTVNPNGLATTAYFQYGVGSGDLRNANVSLSPVDGTSEQPVSAAVSDLLPSTTYTCQLIATNADGTVSSSQQSFTTAAGPALPGEVDAGFNPGVNAVVYAPALQPDGRLVIGGSFSNVGGVTRNCVARLSSSGTLDGGFNPNASLDVFATAVQTDGKVVVAGRFTSVGGVVRNRVARVNTDGTLDAGFNPNVNGDVYSTAIQPDGKIIIGGRFTSVGGVTRNRLARLNADGTLDGGLSADANSDVYALTLQPDGRILVGGDLTTLNGFTRNRIARLNADGTLDGSFDPDAGSFSYVATMTVQPDGKIVVGGWFSTMGGVARANLARLNPDGTLDAGFAPRVAGEVTTMVPQCNGKLVIGGNFSSVDWITRNYIAQLNADGSLDTSFVGSTNGPVRSLAAQADGRLVLGGDFLVVDGFTHYYLARLANVPAGGSLAVSSQNRIQWLRSGSSPEAEAVTFEYSADGQTWSILGAGTRIAGGWELAGLDLPVGGQIRARARVTCGRFNGSSGLVEALKVYGTRPATQVWAANFDSLGGGNDLLAGMAIDPAGNVVVTGSTYTAKFAAADGALLWTQPFPGVGQDVAVDSAGNVFVTGRSSGTSVDTYTAKYAGANGTLMWQRSYDGPAGGQDTAYSIAVDATGNAVIAGYSVGVSGDDDWLVIKYAGADGVTQWTVRYDGNSEGDDRPSRLALDAGGNVLVTGSSARVEGGAYSNDAYTAKYAAANGQLLWEHRYQPAGSGFFTGIDLAVDAGGNVIMGGASLGVSAVAKFAAADGTLLWDRVQSGLITPIVSTVGIDAAGNVLVAGDVDIYDPLTGASQADCYAAKYAATDGTILWQSRSGSYDAEQGLSVAVDRNGNLIVAGESFLSGGTYDPWSNDYYAARYDGVTGAPRWEARYDGPAHRDDRLIPPTPRSPFGPSDPYRGHKVGVTADGGAIVAGTSQNSAGNYDYAIVRFAPDNVTQLPTLAAPAPSTLTKVPVHISFNLPEAALGASVTLTFAGAQTRVLTLATSQETKGAHDFTFDPANPTASPQIASGSPVPDGVYAVTLGYQDALGNPVATASSANVTIDTTPPVITVLGANPATATVDSIYTDAGATAADSVSGTLPVVPGGTVNTALPGSYTITYTVTDDAGNSATVARTVLVPHTPYADWRANIFGTQAGDPAVAGNLADPNGNGLGNLLEYALGGDPVGNGTDVRPTLGRDGMGHLVLSFTRFLSRDDLTLTVQGADRPAGPWTELARSSAGAAFTALEPGVTVMETGAGDQRAVAVSDTNMIGDAAHPHRFLRLEVIR